MNKNETAKLLMLIKSHYHFFLKDADEIAENMIINSWNSFFEDIPVEIMVKAVQNHILTSDSPPTVKQLREQALKLINPSSAPLSPDMAWEMGRKAVIRFGRYRKDDGMEYLRNESEAIAKAINAVGWERICNSSNEELAFRKNEFASYYNEVSADNKQDYLMPKGMLEKLKQMQIEQLNKANGEPE